MRKFIPTLIFLALCSCQNETSLEARQIQSINDNTSNTNDGFQEAPPTTEEPSEPTAPSIEGPQVCYENSDFESCHKLVHKSEIDAPQDYVYNSNASPQYLKPDYFIDLSHPGTHEMITKNFSRLEYLSPAKGRYAILSPLFAQRVQNMRDRLGQAITVNSAYRGPAYNKQIGGAQWSRHMYGDAIDFKVSGKTPSQLKEFCELEGASFIQLYTTHIHCDWRNSPQSPEFFPTGTNPSTIITKAHTTNLNIQTHMEFYEHIELAQEDISSSEKHFKVLIHETEEGHDNLLIEWKVFKDNELLFSKTQPELNLSLENGAYVIQALVGGYWTQQTSFEITN